ncbi:MAG: hypothetical protein JZU65_24835, partial [Chlorobium sp.]|nr:hypothetical protein [Chlorobium sp.]
AIRQNTLPLGISFFTFQQIAFLFYLRQHKDNHSNFSAYSTAVCFFPHLVSGPLLKYESIMSQLETNPVAIDYKKIWLGLVLFILGLSKKFLSLCYWEAYGMVRDGRFWRGGYGMGAF